MGVYQRNDRWMVFYHDENGKRRDRSLGKGDSSMQLAETINLAIREARKDGWKMTADEVYDQIVKPARRPAGYGPLPQYPQPGTGKPKRRVTFEELCSAYVDDLISSGRSNNHIKTLGPIIRNTFYANLDKKKLADEFDYLDDILPFLMAMRGNTKFGKPRAEATINRYADYLDAIFNFGIRAGLIEKNPVKVRRKIKTKPYEVKLTVPDIKKIMDAAEPHIRWAMEVCFNLGLRSGMSELLAMKWENVDFEKSEVKIYGQKTKTFRTVPVTEIFLDKLKDKKSVARSEYIVEYKGNQVKNIAKGFRNACVNAGITYPTRMYDLRHMFASTMLANGADLAAVSKLMGHSSIKMTADTYYQYMKGEKERAVNLLPAIELV